MESELTSEPVNHFKGNKISMDPARGEKDGQRQAFIKIRATILSKLRDNLDKRFPRVDILDAMQVTIHLKILWIAYNF